jgi:hypothetical protein
MTLPALLKTNTIISRVTWVLLSVGLIDHFSCELEVTSFACEFCRTEWPPTTSPSFGS